MKQVRTRHQEAVDRIAQWIIAGRFEEHGNLPREDELSAELGLSRTVVREAMRTLVAKGMVSVRPRHGTHLLPREKWNLFDPQVLAWRSQGGVSRDLANDLMDFRLGIEPFAADLAARRSDFPIGELEEAFARMSRAAVEGEGSYESADLDFHKSILMGSGNQFLQHLVPLMANALTLSFQLSVENMETARSSLPMHRNVVEAIRRRDPDAARQALATLIESARKDIFALLSRRS